MSVHAGTVVTGRPSSSWWKNSGCSSTRTLSGEVWLKTTSIMTLSPAACAPAMRASKSASVPSSGLTARWSRIAYGLPSAPLRPASPIGWIGIR